MAFGLVAFGGGQLHLFATLRQTQSEGDWHSIPGFITTRLGLGTVGQITGIVLGVVFVSLLGWLVMRVARERMDLIDGAGMGDRRAAAHGRLAAAVVRRLAAAARRPGHRPPPVARVA